MVRFVHMLEDAPIPDPNDYQLSRRQLRTALVLNGLLEASIIAAIDAIEEPTEKALARIEWEDAPYHERSHPLFDQLAPALCVTSAQIDAMWLAAKDLPA